MGQPKGRATFSFTPSCTGAANQLETFRVILNAESSQIFNDYQAEPAGHLPEFVLDFVLDSVLDSGTLFSRRA